MSEFETIYGVAEGNFGLITSAEVRANGIRSSEVDQWVKCGRLEKVSRGVYRVSNYPASELDKYAAAVESVGADAYLWGASVLEMLKLSPVNPEWFFVASPKRVRKQLSSSIKVVKGAAWYRAANYEGVRAQNLVDAIRCARGYVSIERRIEAAKAGYKQGYLIKRELEQILKEIKNDAAA